MIAVVNYEVGNIRSVEKALRRAAEGLEQEVVVTADRGKILAADGVLLPGVGAFGACITNLQRFHLQDVVLQVVERGTPLLGICVGMQMLFEESEEMGCWPGLGLLPGRVRRFPTRQRGSRARNGDCGTTQRRNRDSGAASASLFQRLRVPQIGWNQLHHDGTNPLLRAVPDGAYAYFVHSYYCDAADPNDVVATTDYGVLYPSVVNRGHVWGIQCHPEKSHRVGLRILRNFVEIVNERAS